MDLDRLLREQGGTISRRQVFAEGGNDTLIERMVRRRLWRPVHPGVYVDHTGVPSHEQVRTAAVLYAWPAALGGESALIAHGSATVVPACVTVAIDHSRRVRPRPGMRIVRLDDLQHKVLWNRQPPRLRLEVAVLHVASERLAARGESAAVAALADACQQRLTTPERLLTTVVDLPTLRGRGFLRSVLDDVATGAFSVLEHQYLTRVERPHGLPRGCRQRGFRQGGRKGFRDVHYVDQCTLVELDGRLGHEWASDQWDDLERDLWSATELLMTIRLGWGAVSAPCRVAKLVGQVLQRRGWAGAPRPCLQCHHG